MQQGDYSSVYYRLHQPHFQNPNPNPYVTPNHNDPYTSPASYASAPPISSSYSPSDYSVCSSTYPPYSQNHDPVPTAAVSFPNSNSKRVDLSGHPLSFPHLMPSEQTQYYPYDQNPPAPNYDVPNYNDNSYQNSSYSGAANSGSRPPGASTPPFFENPYENGAKYDAWRGYFEESSVYEPESFQAENTAVACEGSKVEHYGARGVGTKLESSNAVIFDDYGRPINASFRRDQVDSPVSSEVVKAIPKAYAEQEERSGVQKFRTILLAETAGQTNVDVLCQIGLDGIRMLDPSTGRMLKIYPLDTVTKWEVLDSYIFAFWAKSSVDIEPRRIRLKSNHYTTNSILDTVTAAAVQFKEIGGTDVVTNSAKVSEFAEKKKGITDWVNLMKPRNEEKEHWVPDEAVSKCTACGINFGAFIRRHHCRNCGDIFCDKCTQGRIALTTDEQAQPVRVCDRCLAEVTQRQSNTREAAGRVTCLQSHEDLAKKLQEEMEKKRKPLSGFKSDGFGTQMRGVACPTCTVHLQVQVPSSGAKTVECSVCQHPFLVNAH